MDNEVLTFDMVDDLRAELEASRVECADLAGRLRDVTAERDGWQAAHAERSQKVAALRALLARAKAQLNHPMVYMEGRAPFPAITPLDVDIDAALAASGESAK